MDNRRGGAAGWGLINFCQRLRYAFQSRSAFKSAILLQPSCAMVSLSSAFSMSTMHAAPAAGPTVSAAPPAALALVVRVEPRSFETVGDVALVVLAVRRERLR